MAKSAKRPVDLQDVRVPAKGPFSMGSDTYGVPGTREDGEAIVELGGMRFGNQRQINPATAREKQPVPRCDPLSSQLGSPPPFSSMTRKRPRD